MFGCCTRSFDEDGARSCRGLRPTSKHRRAEGTLDPAVERRAFERLASPLYEMKNRMIPSDSR
jgi:hypothetical protein